MTSCIKEIMYLPTWQCNFSCIHCGQEHLGNKKEELPLADILRFIHMADCVDPCTITISGGEPFIKDGIEDFVVQLLNDAGGKYAVSITSNGYFTDKIRRLLEAVPKERLEKLDFHISIDGFSDTHNKIRKHSKAFQHAEQTLTLLAGFQVKTTVNTVMQADNLLQLDELTAWIHSISPKILHAKVPLNNTFAQENAFPYMGEEIQKILPYLQTPDDIKYMLSRGCYRMHNCSQGAQNCVIAPNGDVYPCYLKCIERDQRFCMGTLTDSTLDEILQRRNPNLTVGCVGCNSICDIRREMEVYGLKLDITLDEVSALYEAVDKPPEPLYDLSFSPQEEDEGGKFRWMTRKQGTLYFKNPKVDQALLKLRVSFPPLEEGLHSFFVTHADGQKYSVTYEAGMTEVSIALHNIQCDDLVFPITIETDILWTPSVVYGSKDERTLGLAFYDAKLFPNECANSKTESINMNNDYEQKEFIDVAAIMREIKAQVERETSWGESISNAESEPLNQYLAKSIHIQEFILNTREHMSPYLAFGMRIPTFGRFNLLLRKIFTIIARAIRKATRYIAKDQTLVNQDVFACIKALTEYNEQLQLTIRAANEGCKNSIGILESRIEMLNADCLQYQLNNDLLQTKLAELTGTVGALEGKLLECYGTEGTLNERIQYLEERADKVVEMDPAKYLEFENKHRGSENMIKARLWNYVDRFIVPNFKNLEQDIIVDLGCGRGEFLELMRTKEYSQVVGVDLNSEMVRHAQDKGLDVKCQDALSYLKELPDESVSVISAFQLIEHIDTEQLDKLLEESYRVLRFHGVLILETPNPENIEVGSSSFYVDPTHKRPVHPDYLKFAAEHTGYWQAELYYWKSTETDSWLNSVIESDNTTAMDSTVIRTMLESLKRSLYASPDYALIATK